MPAAAFAALRSSSFRTYLTGYAAASTGTWMRSVAQDWLVLELTGSPAAVGVTMACQFLPVLLLGLHGGLLADRRSRRALLLAAAATNAAVAAVAAGLTLTGTVQAVHVDVLALVGGLVLVVENPTRQAFVTQIVPPACLQPAVALAAAVPRRAPWSRPRPASCARPCGTSRSVRRWPPRSCWWVCSGCSG